MGKLFLKVLSEFGIKEVESIIRIEDKDMWNIDDKWFIKTYNDLTLLKKILLINTELYRAGVPVAVYNKINNIIFICFCHFVKILCGYIFT